MKRAKQDLSHYRLLSGDMGFLYPCSCLETIPGDTFRQQSAVMLRMQPLMTPLLHPVNVRLHHWFVPSRLLWDGFEKFITGQDTQAQIPTVNTSSTGDDVLDYLGVPPTTVPTAVNALPLRAYNKIFNEFYRDQDIDPEVVEDSLILQRVRWEKDYFTTARTYAQSGELGEAAQITFSNDTPILGIGVRNPATGGAAGTKQSDGSTVQFANEWTGVAVEQNPANVGFPNVRIPAGSVGGSLDINQWRQAMALQRYREHRNRYGSRYVDYLRYLGVKPSDARLDRPEYLGGGRATISFSEVLQTAETTEVPLGTQAGHGIASVRTKPYRRFFEEHGYVITLLSVRPRSMYQQALHRKFLRQTKDDFWQLENEVMGEQAVSTRELYADTPSTDTTFGYVQRHDDYRHEPSSVLGGMRKTEYDTWHMARKFDAPPVLNTSFLNCDPTNRVFRSQNDPQLYMMAQHRIAARRIVSKRARAY